MMTTDVTVGKRMRALAAAAFMLLALIASLNVSAQVLNPALHDIVDSYLPWGSVEFNGKLRQEKLPVTPTVRMFMVRDSLIQISLRAPLVGELGRVNITKGEILIVNKMKKVYVKENPEKLFEMYPNALADLQSLFLARVTFLGQGELSAGNAELFTIQEEETGNWYILPQTEPGAIPFNYGYVVGKNSRTLEFMGAIPGRGSLTVDYSYQGRGMQMDFLLDKGGRKTRLEFDFSSVKWGGSPLAAVRLLDYRQVSIKDFFTMLR